MDFYSQDAKSAMLSYVTRNTSHIEQQVNAHVYPEIQYTQLIPVDTSAHEFATSVTYYSSNQMGKAEFINGDSDDIPLASTERDKHETGVHMAGIGYGWGLEEIGQAMMVGRNLQAEDAMAARLAYEHKMDDVALRGDAEKGFEGFINHSAVAPAAADKGDWHNGITTADQMNEDVNQGLLGVGTATGYTSEADTLLLSPEKLAKLGTTRVEGTDTTAFNFLKTNNVYTMTTGQPLTIRAVRGLNTAGAGGTSRMIAYRYDPTVLKLHIPMPHRFLPVFQTGALNYVVPGIFRTGGLDIRRSAEVRYIDGI